MPIRQVTPKAEISGYIDRKLDIWKQLLVRNFLYVGEQVLNAARSTDSYKDRTGNLRSSVGYVLVVDGQVYEMSSFNQVLDGRTGKQGGEWIMPAVSPENTERE